MAQASVFLCQCSERVQQFVEYHCLPRSLSVHKAESISELPAWALGTNQGLVFLETDSPASLAALTGRRAAGNVVLFTNDMNSLFPRSENIAGFLSGPGLCYVQEGWNEQSLNRILDVLTCHEQNIFAAQWPFITQISFYVGNRVTHGFTRKIGREGAIVHMWNLGDPPLTDIAFSIRVDPLSTITGQCVLRPNTKEHTENITQCQIDFLELPGQSRYRLNELTNGLITLQKPHRPGTLCTDGETLRFLGECIAPALAGRPLDLRLKTGGYDKSYSFGGRPWIGSILLEWIHSCCVAEAIASDLTWLEVSLRRTPTGKFGLILSLSLPNTVEVMLNNYNILQSHSLVRSLVQTEQVELLANQGLALQQYPEEPNEHLAICLEETE